MTATVVLGAQWGDEGKGKLVDILARNVDICARCQGGSNAGHTIVANGKKYAFHLVPSGLVHSHVYGLVGSGVVVHLQSLFKELDTLKEAGLEDVESRLKVSSRAHIVFDLHRVADAMKERELGGNSIGTTKQGIGPAYSTKASRSGLRVHHLFDADFEDKLRRLYQSRKRRYGALIDNEYNVEQEIRELDQLKERLKSMVVDNPVFLHTSLHPTQGQAKKVLIEGANAVLLDIDFGTYPYCTSSNTTIGGCLTGLGIPPRDIGQVIGVVKAYTTRVGGGPFPTELLDAVGEHLQKVGGEFGTTTGRPRRCGWLDLVAVKYGCIVNGYDRVMVTKLDVLSGLKEVRIGVGYLVNGEEMDHFPADLNVLGQLKVKYETLPGWTEDVSACRSFAELPANAQKYVEFIQTYLDIHGTVLIFNRVDL